MSLFEPGLGMSLSGGTLVWDEQSPDHIATLRSVRCLLLCRDQKQLGKGERAGLIAQWPIVGVVGAGTQDRDQKVRRKRRPWKNAACWLAQFAFA